MDASSNLEREIGFNVIIQSKLLSYTFVVGASSDLEREIGFTMLIQSKHVCHWLMGW